MLVFVGVSRCGPGYIWHIVRAGVAVGVVGVYCRSSFFFGEELLNFPVVDTSADGEFEIFFGDRVPVLLYG